MKREYRKNRKEIEEVLNSFEEEELYYLIYDECNKFPYGVEVKMCYLKYVELEDENGDIIWSRDVCLLLSPHPFSFQGEKAKKGTKEEIIEEAIKRI